MITRTYDSHPSSLFHDALNDRVLIGEVRFVEYAPPECAWAGRGRCEDGCLEGVPDTGIVVVYEPHLEVSCFFERG